MDVTLEQAMLGMPTKIKNKEYFGTKAYIEPFIDRMSKYTDNFTIQVRPADQISLNKDGDVNFENIVYNRVWVEALLPDEYAYEGHQQSVSLLYALDTRKPLYKIFKNTVRMACLNMCVFSPELIQVRELEPESAIDYIFANQVMEMTDNTKAMLNKLADSYTKRSELTDRLGEWVDRSLEANINTGFGKVQLAESTAISVYKSLVKDEKSDYYTSEGDICNFDIYNAFTDIITHDKGRDLVNKYEKIYLVKDIMDI